MKFRICNKETAYRGFFSLEIFTVEHELYRGGTVTVRREMLERGDAVAVVLYDPVVDKILLLEQFRIAPVARHENPWMLEIVAGMLNPDEDPEACARRECEEEAGYAPNALCSLGCFYPSPGGMSERIHLFFGQVDASNPVHSGGGVSEEHEDIRVLWVPREQAFAWLAEGKIRSMTPALALHLASPHLKPLAAGNP